LFGPKVNANQMKPSFCAERVETLLKAQQLQEKQICCGDEGYKDSQQCNRTLQQDGSQSSGF
jgi:hypothetical protein